ncbi:hypothetical protein F6P94_23805 (plasmid) [Escherichia coli]|nr:hypothetical protein F6P94_23805 [Escherichia coli]
MRITELLETKSYHEALLSLSALSEPTLPGCDGIGLCVGMYGLEMAAAILILLVLRRRKAG